MYLFIISQFLHQGQNLTEEQIRKIISLTNVAHMDEILDNICVPRVVGTRQHENVKNVSIIISNIFKK